MVESRIMATDSKEAAGAAITLSTIMPAITVETVTETGNSRFMDFFFKKPRRN